MEGFGTLQAWLVVGVPALVLAAGLFLRRTPAAAMSAFFVLVLAFLALALIDRVSAGVFGGLLALLYAAGRGGRGERGPEGPDWRRVESA